MLLLLDILFDESKRSAAGCPNAIRVGPQHWQLPFQGRKLLTQEPRRSPFDEFDQAMNPELWVHADQQMNMIGHDFQFFYFCTVFLAGLPDNFLQTAFNRPDQPLSSLCGTPDHRVVARKKHVPVAPTCLNHCSSLLRWTI